MASSKPPNPFYFPNIEDKLQFLQECIQQVESQLHSRQSQWQKFEAEIQEQALDLHNRILHLEQIGDIRVPRDPRRKAVLETEIQKLEQEKRQMEMEYWRDTASLLRELRQLKKEYRAVKSGALCSQMNSLKDSDRW